jgi:hypothetical protein
MKAKDARQYIEGSALSEGCKELIGSILNGGDPERELSPEDEAQINGLLDVEVSMTNAEIELLDSQIDELRIMKESIDEALEQASGELDTFVEQLKLELNTQAHPLPEKKKE